MTCCEIDDVIRLLKQTVPEFLYERVVEISQSCYARENSKQLHSIGDTEGLTMVPPQAKSCIHSCCTPDTAEEIHSMIQTSVIPVVIAEVIMKLWSCKMYRYVENLILEKSINEGYFDIEQRIFVKTLDGEFSEDDEEVKSDWAIRDHDDVIIELVWEIFEMRKHFEEVKSHRYWIKKSYERLKDFLPELSPELIERHDLTKYAFSQAIGYTLKWVHKIRHPIWEAARNLHVYNEPHHTELWSSRVSLEERQKRIDNWSKVSCHLGGRDKSCPLGFPYKNLEFPYPFLLESLVDMVAVEWERKKGQRLDISNEELVTFEEKYLRRYNSKQRSVILEVIQNIILSEKGEKSSKSAEG